MSAPARRPQAEAATPTQAGGRAGRAQGRHALRQLAEEQRQAMIENFDLEVEDKVRAMMAQLDEDKRDLQLRADCEIAQLPRCVRDMPLGTFVREYGGEVSAAVRGALGLDAAASAGGADGLVALPATPLAIRARRRAAAAGH